MEGWEDGLALGYVNNCRNTSHQLSLLSNFSFSSTPAAHIILFFPSIQLCHPKTSLYIILTFLSTLDKAKVISVNKGRTTNSFWGQSPHEKARKVNSVITFKSKQWKTVEWTSIKNLIAGEVSLFIRRLIWTHQPDVRKDASYPNHSCSSKILRAQ